MACVVAAALVVAIAAFTLVPGFIGAQNDDGVYAVTARSLARGAGYVHQFLLADEPANRYPIVYPLLLAGAFTLGSLVGHPLEAMQWLSVACAAIFVLATGWLASRGLGLGRRVVSLLVLGLAVQPWLYRYANQVMSDVPYAALSTLALCAFAVLAGPVAAPADGRRGALTRWGALGLALGLLVLMRYQGVSLPIALALFLVLGRRRREALALAIGTVLPLVPWGIWLSLHHGTPYAEAARSGAFLGAMTPVQLVAALGTSMRFLVLRLVPGACFPPCAPPLSIDPLVQHLGPLDALGLLLAALVGRGLMRVMTLERGQLSVALALYVLVSLAVMAVWNVSFTFLGYGQAMRLGLALLPWLMVMALRGLDGEVLGEANGLVVGLLLAGLVGGVVEDALYVSHPLVSAERAAAYMRAMSFLDTHTPRDARVASQLPAMVYLYTNRRGTLLALEDSRAFWQLAVQQDVRYVFLVHGLYGYLASSSDPLVAFESSLARQHPGRVQPVYQDSTSGMEILELDLAAR